MASFFTYTHNDLLRPNIIFTRNAPQPPLATSESLYYPFNSMASLQISSLVDRDWAHVEGMELSHVLWAARLYRNDADPTGGVGGYFNPRFSDIPETGISVDQGGDVRLGRFNYSSMANAMAATVIKTMWSLGYTEGEIEANSYVLASPFDFSAGNILPFATLDASPATYFTDTSGGAANPNEFWSATDVAWLPTDKIVNIPSVVERVIDYDYECQDGRSETQTVDFLTSMASLCHAKNVRLAVWPNSLGNTGAIYSGLTDNNLFEISEVVDTVSLMIWADGTTSIEDLLEQSWSEITRAGAVNPNPSKIVLTFSVGDPNLTDTTIEEAKYVKQWAKNRGISRFRIWRNWGVPGDPDGSEKVNQQIGVLGLDANVRKNATNNILF